MSSEFDPYQEWLGIEPSGTGGPSYYELMGLDDFESDPEQIEEAFDDRYARVRKYQVGDHSQAALQLLQELSRAHVCLLDAGRRAAYDATLGGPAAPAGTEPSTPPESPAAAPATPFQFPRQADGAAAPMDEEQLARGVQVERPPPEPPPRMPGVLDPAPAAPAQNVDLDAAVFLVQMPDGRRFGPLSQSQLDQAVVQQRVPGTAKIWREGWLQALPATELYPMLAGQPGIAVAPAGGRAAAPAAVRSADGRYRKQDPRGQGRGLYAAILGLASLAAVALIVASLLFDQALPLLLGMLPVLGGGLLLLGMALYESPRLFNSSLASPLRGALGDAGARYTVFGIGLAMFAVGFGVLGLQTGNAYVARQGLAGGGGTQAAQGGGAGTNGANGQQGTGGGGPTDPGGQDGKSSGGETVSVPSGSGTLARASASGPLGPLNWRKVAELPNSRELFALSSDGNRIARVNQKFKLEMWELQADQMVRKMLSTRDRAIGATHLAVGVDGTRVAVCANRFELFDNTGEQVSRTPEVIQPIAAHHNQVIGRHGRSKTDPGLIVWDLLSWRKLTRLPLSGTPELLDIRGNLLACAYRTPGLNREVAVYQLPLSPDAQPLRRTQVRGQPLALAVSREAVAVVVPGKMLLFNRQMELMGEMELSGPRQLCLLDQGGVLASAAARSIKFRNMPDGRELGEIALPGEPKQLEVSDNDRVLAVLTTSNVLQIYRRNYTGGLLAAKTTDDAVPTTTPPTTTPPTTTPPTTTPPATTPPTTTPPTTTPPAAARPAWAAADSSPAVITGISPNPAVRGAAAKLQGRGLEGVRRVVCTQGSREILVDILSSSDSHVEIQVPNSLNSSTSVTFEILLADDTLLVAIPQDAAIMGAGARMSANKAVVVERGGSPGSAQLINGAVLVQPDGQGPRVINGRVYLMEGATNGLNCSNTVVYHVPGAKLRRSGFRNQYLAVPAIIACPIEPLKLKR